jgi:hypothetical protein
MSSLISCNQILDQFQFLNDFLEHFFDTDCVEQRILF